MEMGRIGFQPVSQQFRRHAELLRLTQKFKAANDNWPP
jgi:hypothetical protein